MPAAQAPSAREEPHAPKGPIPAAPGDSLLPRRLRHRNRLEHGGLRRLAASETFPSLNVSRFRRPPETRCFLVVSAATTVPIPATLGDPLLPSPFRHRNRLRPSGSRRLAAPETSPLPKSSRTRRPRRFAVSRSFHCRSSPGYLTREKSPVHPKGIGTPRNSPPKVASRRITTHRTKRDGAQTKDAAPKAKPESREPRQHAVSRSPRASHSRP